MESKPNRNIFISYRRADNATFVARIHDWFVKRYGRENVFMDVDSIPEFVDFEKYIHQKVLNCDVLIAIIGPNWLKFLNEKKRKGEKDYVKFELELAIQEAKIIAPICIGGAAMPSNDVLPNELQPMVKRNAAHLREGKLFLDNIERVIEALEIELKSSDVSIFQTSENKSAITSTDEKYNITLNIQIVTGNSIPTHEQTEAYKLFYDGAEKFAAANFDGAIKDYSKAIELYRDFAWAYNSRGAAKRITGNIEAALEDYQEAIYLNSNIAEFHYNKGILHYILYEFGEAIECFSKAIDINPLTEFFNRRATSYYFSGDNAKAFADYATAISKDQESWEAYNNRGALHLSLNNPEKAIEDIDKALKLIENLAQIPEGIHAIYYNRGRAELEQSNYQEALDDFDKSLRYKSDFAPAYEFKAHVFAELEDHPKAIEFYDKAIEYDPSDSMYFNNRGWSKYELQQYEDAIRDFNEAIKLNHSFAEAYNNRGLAKRAIGDLDGASLDYTLAIEFNHSNLEWPFNNRALVHISKENLDLALDDFEEAISANRQYANSYINRSAVYRQKNMVEEAILDLEKYLELDGGNLNNNQNEVEAQIDELKGRLGLL